MPVARQRQSFLYDADCSAPAVHAAPTSKTPVTVSTLSSLPESYAGPDRSAPPHPGPLPQGARENERDYFLFGLAPGGVCQAKRIAPPAGALLPHRFTLTGQERVEIRG